MQNLCNSFLLESLEAIHDFRVDSFKLALYTASASLDPKTVTAYSATNEVAGTGYTAGGVALHVASGFPKLSLTGACLSLVDFDDVGPIAGTGFSYRYGLIYNASKGNRAVAVVDFATLMVVTSSYGVSWPSPDDANCLIRLGA